ncbi:MAG: hypothetical protein JWN25_1031 [Verrucomicrobiales bacterium]|nr:hypothetical protein [Verrucomicrobiales bacterium]
MGSPVQLTVMQCVVSKCDLASCCERAGKLLFRRIVSSVSALELDNEPRIEIITA